jgi:hypothetical protein
MIWIAALLILLYFPSLTLGFEISKAAWSNSVWEARCKDVRTSYNPNQTLKLDGLTLTP